MTTADVLPPAKLRTQLRVKTAAGTDELRDNTMGAPAATPQTPLPKAAMAVVFLIQISEALGGFALFPFVVFMLRATRRPDGDSP